MTYRNTAVFELHEVSASHCASTIGMHDNYDAADNAKRMHVSVVDTTTIISAFLLFFALPEVFNRFVHHFLFIIMYIIIIITQS